jgi:hypothetical protein
MRIVGPLAMLPMTSRREVSQISGMIAKGSVIDRITWLRISVDSVFTPRPITISAGIIVSSRRKKMGTFHPMNPSTII